MSQLSNTRLTPQARPVDRMILPERADQNNDLTQLANALAPFSEKVAAIRDRQLAFSEDQKRKEMEAYATAEAAKHKNIAAFEKASADGLIKYQDVPWVQLAMKQQVSLNQAMTNMRAAVGEYQNSPLALSEDSEAVKQFFVQKMTAGIDENDPNVAAYVAPHILDRAEKLATQHVQSRSTERRKEILEGVSKTAFDNLDPSVNGIAAVQETLDQYGRFIPASELTAALMDGVSRRVLTSEDLSGPLQALTGLMVTGPDGKRVPLLDSVDAKDRIAKIGEVLDDRMSAQVRQGEQAERRRIKNETESLWAQFDKFRETNPGASALSFKLPQGTSREAAVAYISQAASIDGDMHRIEELSRKEEAKPALKLLADGVVNMGLTPQQALDQRLPDGRTVREVVALNDAAPEVNRIFSLAPQVDEGEVADISSEILAGGQTDGTRLESIKGQVPRGTYDRLKVQLEKNRVSANNIPRFDYMKKNDDPLNGFFILESSIKKNMQLSKDLLDPNTAAEIDATVRAASSQLTATVEALNADPTLSQAEKTKRAHAALWEISAGNQGLPDMASYMSVKKKVEKAEAEADDPAKIKPTDPMEVAKLVEQAQNLGQSPEAQEVKRRLSYENAKLAADQGKLTSFNGLPLYDNNVAGAGFGLTGERQIPVERFGSEYASKFWSGLKDIRKDPAWLETNGAVLLGQLTEGKVQRNARGTDPAYLSPFKDEEDFKANIGPVLQTLAPKLPKDPDELRRVVEKIYKTQLSMLQIGRLNARNPNGINKSGSSDLFADR